MEDFRAEVLTSLFYWTGLLVGFALGLFLGLTTGL